MSRMTKMGFLVAMAGLAVATAASAHPQVKQAGPAPGSVVKQSPKAIRIQFNEAIVPGLSGLEVTNAAGQKQNTGTASADSKDKAQLIVPVSGDLAPGKYTVSWHAVGDDTHRVEGKFNFEVKP